MKHFLIGSALAALVIPGAALAQSPQPMPPRPWVEAYFWGPQVHAQSDFMAAQLNRAVLVQIGLAGAVGLDRVALNPQPLPPKAR